MGLREFVRESNRIEGIDRDPTERECAATDEFLCAPMVTISSLKTLVGALQPDARLRDLHTLNVRVGAHVAPRGGPEIVLALEAILDGLINADPYRTHHEYETLHPFTDGNGRSGRALWLWQMTRMGFSVPRIGFLHTWYYQSLQARRVDAPKRPIDQEAKS